MRTLSSDGCHRLMSTNETQMRWWDWDWISHFWTYFCPYLLSDPTRLSLVTCSTLNTLNYAVKYPSNKDLLETCELKWNSHCTWTANTPIKLPHLELCRNVPENNRPTLSPPSRANKNKLNPDLSLSLPNNSSSCIIITTAAPGLRLKMNSQLNTARY